MYLNEATLLNNVRVRYSKDKIYVSMAAPLFLTSGNQHSIHTTYQCIPLVHEELHHVWTVLMEKNKTKTNS